MSLAGKRFEIAAALSTVTGVTGHASRPAAAMPGDAWPLLGPMARGMGSAFEVTWLVRVLLPQDEIAAMEWLDAHWAGLFFALSPIGFVDSAIPVSLPVAGGEQFAFEITLRGEE